MNETISTTIQQHPQLAECSETFQTAFEVLRDCVRADGTLFLAGNGGSAADADHWSGELLKGFRRRRPLSVGQRASLPTEMGELLQGGIRSVPLTGFPAFSSAFANDVSPHFVWAQLVYTLGRKGDVFIGISTSGNAQNVCHAAEAAKAKGLIVIGLTGASGGRLRHLSDVCICVPASETYEVQELHLPTYHCLSSMLEEEFFAE